MGIGQETDNTLTTAQSCQLRRETCPQTAAATRPHRLSLLQI